MNLASLSDSQLEDLHVQCTEVIAAVLSRLEGDRTLQDSVRRLVQAADISQEFTRLEADSAGLVLQVAVAILVN